MRPRSDLEEQSKRRYAGTEMTLKVLRGIEAAQRLQSGDRLRRRSVAPHSNRDPDVRVF
jgi:hypothetical protein